MRASSINLVVNMTRIIEVEKLFFKYPRMWQWVLENVTFSVQTGECLGILGENGSGKTTLLYHLNGIIPNVIEGNGEGIVKVLGKVVRDQAVFEVSEKVGTMLQDPEAQMLGSTVYTQCASHISNLGSAREEIERKVDQSLVTVGLFKYQRKNPKMLSYGEMQKLSLATSLSISPQLLLLDEPFSNIDAKSGEEIISLLEELKQQKGMAIIIATQESKYIRKIADKILVLKDGKISHFGKPRAVFKQLLKEKSRLEIPRISILIDRLDLEEKIVDSKFPITVEEGYNLISAKVKKDEFRTKIYKESENESPILSLKNVAYSYPDGTAALRDISFDIYPSELLGIVGNNGAGKTTLVYLLLKLLAPYKGSIVYNTTELQNYPNDRLYDEVGLVLQHPEHQLLGKSVEEEVEEVLRNRSYSEEEIIDRIEESLDVVNLKGKRTVFSEKLSYGEKKKLSIATVIATSPKIIMLDEPSTGIDYRSRVEIAKALNKLKQSGCAVVVITHDMEYVSEYADNIVVLRDGAVSKKGLPVEVFEDTKVLEEARLKVPELAQLGNLLNIHFSSYTLQEVAETLRGKMK